MGAFACCPLVCERCARSGLDIQRRRHHSEWGDAVELIESEQERECVREYLRGIYQRAREAQRAKGEA